MDIEVLMPLSKVPNGATIRKVTGQFTYTVQREVKVNKESLFKCDKDSVLLVGDNQQCNFYVTAASTKVVVIMDPEELVSLIEEQYCCYK